MTAGSARASQQGGQGDERPGRRVVLLGSTGSIGQQALEVAAAVPGLRVVGLAAGSSAAEVVAQAAQCGAGAVVLQDEVAAQQARQEAPQGVRVLQGDEGVDALLEMAASEAQAAGEPLTVLNGIVGAAGLRATLATLRRGLTLALANKESLVAGGPFVLQAARRGGAMIIPVDSEHSAVFQCLLAARPARGASGDGADEDAGAPGLGGRLLRAEQIVLTGSGGPFRGRTRAQLAGVTPQEALRHPTWSMGQKISIDSSTLMNKGLEVIEAHYLFGVPYERIEVLINRQSIVHALVRYADGAVVAHLGMPDMRAPIGYALTWPERDPLPMVEPLDLTLRDLSFERPDTKTFGCLRLAYEAGRAGGAAPLVLNAANEVAVHAFLGGDLDYLGIEATVAATLAQLGAEPVHGLEDVFALDEAARRVASQRIAARSPD